MADEVSNLVIKVTSDAVATATQRLDVYVNVAVKADKATDKLAQTASKANSSFGSLVAKFLTIGAAIKVFDTFVKIAKSTEDMEAQLTNATGSLDRARDAFEALEKIKTYDTIEETTKAFLTLQQNGLDPSSRALQSYANIAAQTGKKIQDISETLVKAADGQFRGLEQLGIKAIKTQEGVTLIFRGNATKLKGDAESIQEYVQKIGNVDFAGAAAAKAATLGGKLDDLGDAYDDLYRAINRAGVGNLLGKGFDLAKEALEELTDAVKSGQIAGYIDAVGIAFETFYKAATDSVSGVTKFLKQASLDWSKDGSNSANSISDAFLYLPENVTAVAKAIGATLAAFVGQTAAVAQGIYDAFKNQFNLIVELSVNTGKALATNLNPFSHEHVSFADYLKQQEDATKKFSTTNSEVFKETVLQVDRVGTAWQDVVADVLNERDATIKAFDSKIVAADKLRSAYDKVKDAKNKSDEDPLAKTRKPRGEANTDQESVRAFEALKKELQLEEVTIQQSYERRLLLIQKNTAKGSDEQIGLLKQLNARTELEFSKSSDQHEANVLAAQAKLNEALTTGQFSQVDTLQLALKQEEELLQQSYAKRKEQILADTTKTQSQKDAIILKLEAKATQQQREIEIARNKQTLDTTADFFGNISKIAAVFGAKGAKIAKAAAIVQATIKTYESAVSAYSSLAGIPYVGPALGAAAAGAAIAAGLANVAQIKAQDYAGNFATGGFIPAGMYGVVNEAGAEVVRGPTTVESARSTRDRYGSGQQPTEGTKVFVNVNNSTDSSVNVQERDTAQGKTIDIIIKRAVREIAAGIRTGASPVSNALESTYKVNRGNAT
jgi:hypothetical protein